MTVNKIAVIGGGAAGILAALYAKENNNEVTIFEKNKKLGKKLYITGKGRCNITNDSEPDNHIKNCVKNREFLYSPLYSYQPFMIVDLLNNNGLSTKVERGNRVFPYSDKASDVVKCLENILISKKVKIKLSTNIIDIKVKGDIFEIFSNEEKYEFNNVIITTGGLTYPGTGSDGKFFSVISKLGHSISKCRPALTSFITKEDTSKLAGLTLKNVELNVENIKLFGDLMFTHRGISGPIVLTASSLLGDEVKFPLLGNINLKPAISLDMLDKRILREIDKSPKRSIGNMLKEILPIKLIPYIIKEVNIDEYRKSSTITKDERHNIINNIQNFKFKVTAYGGYNDAVITRGGVNVKEINPHTMESKIVKGLYFAGEVIDIDSLTGGYNLQIAWSTGYLAGISQNLEV